jgi:hypothetical protein
MYSAKTLSINVTTPMRARINATIVPNPAKGTPKKTHAIDIEIVLKEDKKKIAIPKIETMRNGILEKAKIPLIARSITLPVCAWETPANLAGRSKGKALLENPTQADKPLTNLFLSFKVLKLSYALRSNNLKSLAPFTIKFFANLLAIQ